MYFDDKAPIPSNMMVDPQFSSSPDPQNMTSCFPNWICSMPMPMLWAPVLQALDTEYDRPCNLNAVARTAETVEPMVRVTR